MRRSKQYWEPTSDDEYLDHIKRMEKAPTMHPDIPLYPNVYSVFDNKVSHADQESSLKNTDREYSSQKKVQFVESGKFNKKNDQEKNINAEADGYINQKHKYFEIHKWMTFSN